MKMPSLCIIVDHVKKDLIDPICEYMALYGRIYGLLNRLLEYGKATSTD